VAGHIEAKIKLQLVRRLVVPAMAISISLSAPIPVTASSF